MQQIKEQITRRLALWALLGYGVLGALTLAAGDDVAWERIPAGAKWELQMLGVTSAERLAEVCSLVGRRVVTIGIVGQGGISESLLRPHLPPGSSFVYQSCPTFPKCDPRTETHDIYEARIIVALTGALGVRVRLACYHSGQAWTSVAEDFADAGKRCDIVVCLQSFWGNNQTLMTDSIAACPEALFVVPYAESEGRPTGTSMQASSAKPCGDGLANFITCAPLARSSDGSLLLPSNRDETDTEIINFIAPSNNNSTCAATAVTAGVAAYLYAVSPLRPAPSEVLSLLRRSAKVDAEVLTSAPPFTDEHIERLKACIAKLVEPGPGGPRKLDVPGVISLYDAYRMLRQSSRITLPSNSRAKRGSLNDH